MTTDYKTLKKELTKAIKEAGYNTKQIIDILVGIEKGDPAVFDFSEAYLLDGDTEEEVNKNIAETEERIQDRNDEIESLQSDLTESSEKLNKLEEERQSLLNK